MAFEAGTHVITMPVSVSEPHSIANIRKTHAEIIADVRAIVALRNERFPAIKVETSLSTAFGCTIQGVVPEDDVLRMAAAMADAGSDTINLADTVGYANPAQVKRLFTRVRAEVGDKTGGAHLHNTRGQGLANVVAALDAGVTTFDSSQGGIGGCPYAPGATGNIVTEDLVFLLESMGLDTGIDLDRLIAARAILAEALPGEALYGHVPAAGLPKGFTPAAAGERHDRCASARRHPRRRILPHGDGAELRAHPRRSRRRRDQGRAAGRGRQHAAAAGLGRRLLPGVQSQQAEPRARHQGARRGSRSRRS